MKNIAELTYKYWPNSKVIMKGWVFLLFIIASSVCFSQAYADTAYYVDYNYTGSTKNGSQADPWQHRSDINWTTVQTALNSGNVTIYFNSRGVWNDNQYFTIQATGDNYIFTVTNASTVPAIGAVYTAPCGYTLGCTYKVKATNISGGAGTITTTGTGVPTATSGTLALQTGSGQSSITFSAMTYYTLTLDGHSFYDCASSCTTTNWTPETNPANRAVFTASTTTSTTSLTIPNAAELPATQTLTVVTGLTFNPASTVDIINSPANYMVGTVSSYNAITGELVINVTAVIGSGTFSSWTIAGQSAGTIYINNDTGVRIFTVSGITTAPNTSLGAYPIYYYDNPGHPVEGYPIITIPAAGNPMSITGGSGTITTGYAGDLEPTASGQIHKQYIFTVTGIITTPSSEVPTPGAVYTSGGRQFTVITTAISSGAGTITTSGTGDLSSSGSGTLTEFSLPENGVGQSNISFTSVTNIGNGDGTVNYSSFTQNNNNITSNITIFGIEVLYGDSGGICLSADQPTENVNNITINNVVLSTPINLHGIFGGYLESGVYNITVENSTIEKTIAEGIYIGHYDYLSPYITGVVIQNNTLYDIGATQGGTASINLKSDDQGTIVRNNVIYRDSGSVGSGCGIFSTGSGTQIYNNIIYNIQNSNTSVCGGHGVYLSADGDGIGTGFPISNDFIYNNLIFDNEGSGIAMDAEATRVPASVENFKIDNNTIWGNGGEGIFAEAASVNNLTVIEIKNNILGDNNSYNIDNDSSADVTFSNVNNNLYYTTTNKSWFYSGAKTWAQWKALGFDPNGVQNSDPGFINVGVNNYNLASASPAIGTGTNLSNEFTIDLAGNPRSSANNWDMGAYAYPPTLSVSYVGFGEITSSDNNINCGVNLSPPPNVCSESVNAGTSIILTATPATGSVFTSWSGACSGTGSCTVTMNTDKDVTATFSSGPVNGSCGAAQQTYLYNVTSFGSNALCKSGNPSPSTVAFPVPGGIVHWTCVGINNGLNSTCTAKRNARAIVKLL